MFSCRRSFVIKKFVHRIIFPSSNIIRRLKFYKSSTWTKPSENSEAINNDKREGKITENRKKWELALYNRFKDLINKDVTSYIYPVLLYRMLKGVLEENRQIEFMEKYFDRWWNYFIKIDYIHPITLCRTVSMLGEMNFRTNGELRKYYLLDDHLLKIESIFLSYKKEQFTNSL